jgi:hypothetical protein
MKKENVDVKYILALLGICDDAVACRTVPALLKPEGKIVHV